MDGTNHLWLIEIAGQAFSLLPSHIAHLHAATIAWSLQRKKPMNKSPAFFNGTQSGTYFFYNL